MDTNIEKLKDCLTVLGQLSCDYFDTELETEQDREEFIYARNEVRITLNMTQIYLKDVIKDIENAKK